MESAESMSEVNPVIARARQLGRENMTKYACAEGTLLAVADTLKIPVSDEVFKTVIGLSSMSGGCGALCGAIAAIDLRFGPNHDAYLLAGEGVDVENPDTVVPASWYIQLRQLVKRVRDQFDNEYGGYLCCDIQTKLFGRSFDTFDPNEMEAFMQQKPFEKCPQVTENAAGWAVEAILEAEASSG